MKQLRNAKKGSSSSLILGGRFGRSCFLKAGGCLGKRTENHLPVRDINELTLQSRGFMKLFGKPQRRDQTSDHSSDILYWYD
ncbi:unnamed protein product [Acanthoscelides obtectus]|uniref:Uncharacterized protein n=1 Tax=Acanthoscelides obtectus TaxID=200917 RepID=A0A9P0PAC8_ACAOB|nr:unnamed protein product [Acanthoscelides obtectus]CAK1664230.1 hypothetical protein AOBTE_LOCUS24143 [Acanthoscelides obtectus]